jgi:DNA-binding XRE family transcriptional regulator
VIEWKELSCQLIRALRGRRSQAVFARRLRVSTQTIANWENGRRVPATTVVLRAAEAVGVDVLGAFVRFDPELVCAPTNEEAMGEWLTGLGGDRTVQQLALKMKVSRFRASRWLTGDTRIPLPEFLGLVELLTRRLTDLISLLVPINDVPLIAPLHQQRIAARNLAFERPLSEAILRLAETQAYSSLAKHPPGWFADRLRVSREEESECLAAMIAAGVLRLTEGRYEPGSPMSIDTGASLSKMKALKLHWLNEVTRSLSDERSGNAYGYNVVSVSRTDLQRIRELHLDYFRQLRAIVVESEPVETVALIGMQIVEFPP